MYRRRDWTSEGQRLYFALPCLWLTNVCLVGGTSDVQPSYSVLCCVWLTHIIIYKQTTKRSQHHVALAQAHSNYCNICNKRKDVPFEIIILQSFILQTSVKMKLLCTQVVKDILGEGIDVCDCSPHQFWFTSYLSAATRSMVGALRPGRTSVISVSYKLKHAICVTTLDWYTHTVSNFL